MKYGTCQRKSIHTFDCIMICSVLALSIPKKLIKKLSQRHGLSPKQKRFDYWYGFYQLHQHAHKEDSPVSGALTELLDKRHASYVRELNGIDAINVPALKSFIDRGFAASPGGALWALLTDPRDELQSQGVYYAHKLVYNLLNDAATGQKTNRNPCAVETDHDERIDTLRGENQSLQHEVNSLKAQLEKTKREYELLRAERDRLISRIEENECRSRRERRLLRENRMLKYRLETSKPAETAEETRMIPSQCPRIFPVQKNTAETPETNPACEYPDDCPLDALRIAVVGGLDRMEEHYRKTVERLGGEFVFHNGYCNNGTNVLKNMVCGSDIIVFITSVNSHNAMWTVKAECKKTGKKFTVLKHTSPHALEKKLRAEIAG